MKTPKLITHDLKGLLEDQTINNSSESFESQNSDTSEPDVLEAIVVDQYSTFDNFIRLIEALTELVSALSELIKDPKVFTLAVTLAFMAKCESNNIQVVSPTKAGGINQESVLVPTQPVVNPTNLEIQETFMNQNVLIINGIHFHLALPVTEGFQNQDFSNLPVYLSGEREIATSTEAKLQRKFRQENGVIDRCIDNISINCNPTAVLVDRGNFHSQVLCADGSTEDLSGYKYACSQ